MTLEKIAKRVLEKIAFDERGAGKKLLDSLVRPTGTETIIEHGGLFGPSEVRMRRTSMLDKFLENPSGAIEGAMDFIKRHPYISAGLAAGALGYGYGHNTAQNRAIAEREGSKIDKAYNTVAKMDTVGGDTRIMNKLTNAMDSAAAKIKRFSGLGGVVR